MPQQDARKGTLVFKLVPGRYGQVSVKNESRVRDFMVQGTLDTQKVTTGELIEQARLERAMLLTSDLAGAGMPRAVIGAGTTQGASDFLFDVSEQRLIDGFLVGDNFGTPYTGIWRASDGFNINSPLGIGDRLSAFGLVSNSTDMLNGRVAYALPLGYDGLRAEVAAFRTTLCAGRHLCRPRCHGRGPSRHFRVLRDAGLVWTRTDGPAHLNDLRREELNRRFPGLLYAWRRPALLQDLHNV